MRLKRIKCNLQNIIMWIFIYLYNFFGKINMLHIIHNKKDIFLNSLEKKRFISQMETNGGCT